ncbi:MAG TPA: hypothetical protein VEI07_15450 [Planctomycetaceae bacterium]|nr:hypothetical protein [Planctomycetaceae bacterium]
MRSLGLVSACLVVALSGFFGVVWLFTPHSSVDDIAKDLAKIDFDTLPALGDFTGSDIAARLQSEPGWDRLHWKCDKPKGLPLAPGLIAVYGFETRRSGGVQGLIAVIPRKGVRNPPTADSLATAAPTSEYLSARIGESVCVAWQQGDVVCVCVIKGGPDSLSTLQSLLEQPAA